VTTGGNQTYTANAVQLGNGTPGETITFQTTNGGRITFNLGLTANGGGVTAVSGSTGLSAAFTPSIDYVNPAFLTALTAAGIPYTVSSGDSGGSGGSGSNASTNGAGSGMVNTSTTQATSASLVGWLNQLLIGSALANGRTSIEGSTDVGTIFGLHEANEAGQTTKPSASLTVSQQTEPYQPPCEDASVGEDVTVCTAD
jgi:hypothetical protein